MQKPVVHIELVKLLLINSSKYFILTMQFLVNSVVAVVVHDVDKLDRHVHQAAKKCLSPAFSLS